MKLSAERISQTEMEHVRHIIDRHPSKGNFFTKVQSPVNHPRLQRYTTIYSRHDVADTSFWVADGIFSGTLDEVVAWLNERPEPQVTQTELAMLSALPDVFDATPTSPMNLSSLRLKGLIEYETENAARCRRTPLARKVIEHAAR